MTRVEREQLISRYLGGDMNTAEEQEFFIRVAVDKELRQDLRAQRTVDSALRKDRDAESTGHTALRMRVASVLAATPTDPTSIPSEPMPAGAGASTSGVLTLKWIVGIAVGAIATATVVLLPDALRAPDAQERSSAPPSVSQSATDHAQPTPSSAASESSIVPKSMPLDSLDMSTSSLTPSRSTPQLSAAPLRRGEPERLRTRRDQREAQSVATERASPSQASALDADSAVPATADADSFDRNDNTRHDDSIDIGIKLRFPK
jgi:hypothetical protein